MRKMVSFVFAILIIGVIVYAYIQSIPSPGHGADEIMVNIKGENMTLQEALEGDLLLGYNLEGELIDSFVISRGHLASKILLNVSGRELSLQEAINLGSLCSDSSANNYSGEILNGHFGNQTLAENRSGFEKSIQQMVNDKEFCTCGDSICQNSSNTNDYGENETNCPADCLDSVSNGEWVVNNNYQRGCTSVCSSKGKVSGFDSDGFTCTGGVGAYLNYGKSYFLYSTWYYCTFEDESFKVLTGCYCV